MEFSSKDTKQLFRYVYTLAKQLDEQILKISSLDEIFSTEISQKRSKLRSKCEYLLFQDYENIGKKTKEILWRRGYYDTIAKIKKILWKRPDTIIRNDERDDLKLFLLDGIKQFKRIILKFEKIYDLDLRYIIDFTLINLNDDELKDNDNHNNNSSPEHHQNNNSEEDKDSNCSKNPLERISYALETVHCFLIAIGDLHRYMTDYQIKKVTININNQIKQISTRELASKYYYEAFKLNPSNGMSQNQLGTLFSGKTHDLDSVYHYLFSLLCKQPFELSENNVNKIFQKNFDYIETLEDMSEINTTTMINENINLNDFVARFILITDIFFYDKEVQDFNNLCHFLLIELKKLLNLNRTRKINGFDENFLFKLISILFFCMSRLYRQKSNKIHNLNAFMVAICSELIDSCMLNIEQFLIDHTKEINEFQLNYNKSFDLFEGKVRNTRTLKNNGIILCKNENNTNNNFMIENLKNDGGSGSGGCSVTSSGEIDVGDERSVESLNKSNNNNNNSNDKDEIILLENNNQNLDDEDNKKKKQQTKLRRRRKRAVQQSEDDSDSDDDDDDDISSNFDSESDYSLGDESSDTETSTDDDNDDDQPKIKENNVKLPTTTAAEINEIQNENVKELIKENLDNDVDVDDNDDDDNDDEQDVIVEDEEEIHYINEKKDILQLIDNFTKIDTTTAELNFENDDDIVIEEEEIFYMNGDGDCGDYNNCSSDDIIQYKKQNEKHEQQDQEQERNVEILTQNNRIKSDSDGILNFHSSENDEVNKENINNENNDVKQTIIKFRRKYSKVNPNVIIEFGQTEKTLKCLKLLFDWLRNNNEILISCFLTNPEFIQKIIKLLNIFNIDIYTRKVYFDQNMININDIRDDFRKLFEDRNSIPLTEDILLKNFDIFEQNQKSLDWEINSRLTITKNEESLIRIFKFVDFGFYLCKMKTFNYCFCARTRNFLESMMKRRGGRGERRTTTIRNKKENNRRLTNNRRRHDNNNVIRRQFRGSRINNRINNESEMIILKPTTIINRKVMLDRDEGRGEIVAYEKEDEVEKKILLPKKGYLKNKTHALEVKNLNMNNNNNNIETKNVIIVTKDKEAAEKNKYEIMGKLWLRNEVKTLESKKPTTLSLTPYLVMDSKSLTEYTSIVRTLVRSKKFIVLIPNAVLSDLDELKKHSEGARLCIRWLEQEFKKGNRFIRSQRDNETLPLPLLKTPKKLDRESSVFLQIAQFCNYIVTKQNTDYSDDDILTLLTGDNLIEKKSNHFSYFGIMETIPIKFQQIKIFYGKYKKK